MFFEHLGKSTAQEYKKPTLSWYVLLKKYFMLVCMTSAWK